MRRQNKAQRAKIVTLPAGYRYEFDGKRKWKASKSDNWDVVMGSQTTGVFLGRKVIDSAKCIVVRANEKIIAVQEQYIQGLAKGMARSLRKL